MPELDSASAHHKVRVGVRIGVDVGSVRIGVARSDAQGLLATPVRTLQRRPGQNQIAELADLVREADAIEVVVGLPRSLSGARGRAAEHTMDYAEELARRIAPVPVRLVDERLTTVTAHQQLQHSAKSGRARRQVVDQVAAVLILQSALDTEAGTGLPAGEQVDTMAAEDEGTL